MNRLATATSPYLQQHAGNPVDWWPWGEDAFAEARRRDVPLLISVGYSACHWCHVMAHESFEDAGVAGVLNAGFVAVKVDREERPDVDAVYMEAVQLVTGRGGWPMTVLATPDGRPFWAGTYLPRPNFLHLLERVTGLWGQERAALEADAARLAGAVRQSAELPREAGPASLPEELVTAPGPASAPLDPAEGAGALAGLAVARSAASLLARHDPEWGGSSGAPKFPQPAGLEVLAEHWWRSRDPSALTALRRTLDAMSSGGIYDHLAGGFARYSTDTRWLVPHFEKMLYDNALLVRAYTQAFQLTGSARYRQVVDETVAYLLSPPLRLPEGAWASAEDADSEGEEGRFYTWSRDEIVGVAGEAAADWWGASAAGNWEGKNILWRPGIGDLGRSPDLEQARQELAQHRSQRPRPGLDDKVLAEWNAMAVCALAYAGRALGQRAWVEAAAATAGVLLSALRRPDGRWLRSWRPGAPPGPGPLACAADYAWLVEAFTRLGEATGRRYWTAAAADTADGLIDLFWDETDGGFFTYGHDGQPLVARMKDIYDGATPAANSTAARALARLGELTGEPRYREIAHRTWEALSPAFWRAPGVFPNLALAAGYLAHPRRQVVVASSVDELVQPVWARYLPDTVLAWGEPYNSPLWEGRDGPRSTGLAFVCEGNICSLPVRGGDELGALLDRGAPGQVARGPGNGLGREA